MITVNVALTYPAVDVCEIFGFLLEMLVHATLVFQLQLTRSTLQLHNITLTNPPSSSSGCLYSTSGQRISAKGSHRKGRPPKKNVPFLERNLAPHLMHGLLAPPESTPKRHIDRFSRFSTTPTDRYEDKQTDRQTTLQR